MNLEIKNTFWEFKDVDKTLAQVNLETMYFTLLDIMTNLLFHASARRDVVRGLGPLSVTDRC
mgnify:CR=1 FL=1